MKYILSFLSLFLFSTWSYAACDLTIEGNDAMQFDLKEMVTEASCEKITVTLIHTGKLAGNVMGHNWVLVDTKDLMPMLKDAWAAGLDNNYVKPDDKRVLATTKIIGGGETTTVEFSGSLLKAGGDYTFVCSYPGHFGMMKGKFVVN